MTSHYLYLPYRLALEAPAVLTAAGGDPNSAESLDHVPGGALRGAAARALGASPDPGALRELVLGEEVRYLNAYPVVEAQRALPVPVSLRPPKDEADGELVGCWDLAALA